MDPKACWRRLLDALDAGDETEAAEASGDLAEWTRKGGFTPEGCPLSKKAILHLAEMLSHAVDW